MQAQQTMPMDHGAAGSDSNEPLSDKLDRSGGVIGPPPAVDPGMTISPPPAGPRSTPVIPPPGTSDDHSTIRPK
jgi:hypothetical protein